MSTSAWFIATTLCWMALLHFPTVATGALTAATSSSSSVDFMGMYNRGDAFTNGCDPYNPNVITGNCTCPKGALASEDLAYVGFMGNQKAVYCVNDSIKPKSFGGAYQTMKTNKGGGAEHCLSRNIYTKDCSCPEGFRKLISPANHPDQKLVSIASSTSDVRVKGASTQTYANSEIVWCVPTNNAIEPGFYLGMMVSINEKCTVSTPQLHPLYGCSCPHPRSQFAITTAETETSNSSTSIGVSLCFDDCSLHQGKEDDCNKDPLCSFCGSGATGKCHSKEDGTQCCANEIGAMVCDPNPASAMELKSTCCKAPGKMPTCCASPTSKCNSETATCECPDPQTNICGTGDNAACCAQPTSCCPGGPSVCCPKGHFCCGPHTEHNVCCDSETEYCKWENGITSRIPLCASKNNTTNKR